MRIMVTGSRRWVDEAAIRMVALTWLMQAPDGGLTLIHGGAQGADQQAERAFRFLYQEMLPVLGVTPKPLTVEVFKPRYLPKLPKSDPGYAQRLIDNNRAPLRRNDEMLDTHPDVVLAFKLGYTTYGGTQYTINRAQGLGIPVWIVNHPELEEGSVQADEGAAA